MGFFIQQHGQLGIWGCIPLCEGAVKEPGDDGEVLALVVGGQDDRVLVVSRSVLGRHCG